MFPGVIYLALLHAIGGSALLLTETTVTLDCGQARGYVRDALYDSQYISFRGLPYAKQPVQDLRFQPPQLPEPWDGVLDAKNEGPICPEQDFFYGPLLQPQGSSESCLHINVHVPVTTKCEGNKLLPIFVFIHGGAFSIGSSDADQQGPEFLVSKGVIVVTFNYRLGVLGFLSLGTREIPGNAGLRDQLAALAWVQRNARAFGGDPDNVTLGGQSAGAASTHLLALSPASAGLFNRVIIMSGSSIRSFFTASPAYAKDIAALLLKLLNITAVDPVVQFQALQKVSVEAIVNATRVIQNAYPLISFAPVVENIFPGLEPVIPVEPITAISALNLTLPPTLIGFTSAECADFAKRLEEVDVLGTIKANSSFVLTPILLYNSTSEQQTKKSELILERYFSDGLNLPDYLKYCTEAEFIYPALKTARLAQAANSSVYVYRYAYEGVYNVLKQALNFTWSGAAHVEDQLYVLHANSYSDTQEPGTKDAQVRDRMITFFSNFIKTGKPTLAADVGLEFPLAEPCLWNVLDVDSEFTVLDNPYQDMVDFFDSLYDN